jgi:BirA family biotin operon repressor/biotin-[acetyl-CoA-carboxylase] ligase
MDAQQLIERLRGLPIPAVRYYNSIASTNEEALSWADTGAQDGSLVFADHQSRGRGRFNRQWITLPGSALAFSLVLRLSPGEVANVGLFPGLGAMAVSTALENLGCPNVTIKWPNDVLLDGCKVCGILCENNWIGEILDAVVMGIGINVAPSSVPSAGDLLFPATSVQQALGYLPDRLELLQRVLQAFFSWRPTLHTSPFLQGYEQRLAYQGQEIRIEQPDQSSRQGTVVGINPDGSLRLMSNDGEEYIVTAGDVRLRPV